MMNFILIKLTVLLIICILCDAASYKCNKTLVPCGCGDTTVEINARIINGENAVPNSWPMMVSLRHNPILSEHACGGTILSETYILTAAHCVGMFSNDLSLGNLTIVAGIYNLSQSDQIIRQVDKIIIHPLSQEFIHDKQYDIAILHLSEPLDLATNSSITRTCLPSRSDTLEEIMQYPSNGTNLVLIGWGHIDTLGTSPNVLQQVTVKSIHHFDKICANSIPDPETELCAGLYEGGKGTCYADSGGPIFQWIGDRWEQVGIVVGTGKGCALKDYPGIFTRLSYFHDWIQSHIQNNNQPSTFDNKIVDSRVLYRCFQYPSGCGCSRRSVALSPPTAGISEMALPHTWSMIVSIRVDTNNQHICSGTILEDSYILTAAHCVTNLSSQNITIQAGMYSRSEIDTIIREVDHIYIHPNYSAGSNFYINDIAILHLSQSLYVQDDKNNSQTCLPSINNKRMNMTKYLLNGTRLAIVGWDIINRSRFPKSQILQQADIYVIDAKNSTSSDSHSQHELQFCAGRYGNDKEICYGGDFGDPIFQWINDRWIQVGLASYCRMSDNLGVFTRLANYSDWIESIVNFTNIRPSKIYRCDKSASCGCGQNDVDLTISGITGGEDAIEHSWPMIVSILRNNRHICGGTILTDSFILTSARCTSFSLGFNVTIVAGIHRLSEKVTHSRRIDEIYIHPNYSGPFSDLHDIAIVHLDQPLPFDNIPSILAKACVPIDNKLPANEYPELNSQLVVIGWDGGTSANMMPATLQQMPVRLLNGEDELCSNSIIDNNYQFCATPSNNNRSREINYLCSGGFGGPVLMYKNNHWEQVGIISDKYNCYSNGSTEIFTRLSPYIEWMKNVTNSSLITYS